MKAYWNINKMPELKALPAADQNRILKSTRSGSLLRRATLNGLIVCAVCSGLGSVLGNQMLPRWHFFPGWFSAIGGGIGGFLLVLIHRAAWAKAIREAIHAEQGEEPNL